MYRRTVFITVICVLSFSNSCASDDGSKEEGQDTLQVADEIISSDDSGSLDTENFDTDSEDDGSVNVDNVDVNVSTDYDFADEYTPHDPIVIDGNEEFHAMAVEEGWSGDGSKDNPYLITGYEIDLKKKEGGAVDVRNTDVHFVVRSCYLHGGIHQLGNAYGYGVLVWNVQNMRIEQTVATDNWEGVRLEKGSRNCIIHYNDLSNNVGHGIALASAHENIIEYNLCINEKDDGMLFGSFDQEDKFDAANDNIVRYNEFSSNSTSGVCLFRGTGNKFYGNSFGKGNMVAIINTAGKNQWYNEENNMGNWWVNFKGTDEDGDGVWDKKKSLPGGAVDPYPLASRPSTTP